MEKMNRWEKFRIAPFLFLMLGWAGLPTFATAHITDDLKTSRDSVLQNKLFHFVTVLNSENELKRKMEKNKVLKRIGRAQLSRTSSLQHCESGKCYAAAIYWRDDEIAAIGDELLKLLESDKSSGRIIDKIRSSGHYTLYHNLNDTAFVRTVWEYVAQGVNRIFRVYLAGDPPKRYAAIDSISYRQDDPRFVGMVDTAMRAITTRLATKERVQFYEFPIKAAIAILNINGRDEAARYEPLTDGYNTRAFMAVSDVDWSSYKYSVLLVPGFGPEEPGTRLHETGIERCKMAAERFKRGLAPFIIVSGGHVYPFRTPFSEAVEMRRYMIDVLSIPEDAIIIEPHARHTTTNIRNASRIIYRFGLPNEIPGLVVTDAAQTEMIAGLDARCIRELGYVPYDRLNIRGQNGVEFWLSKKVFQVNLFDCLDP